MAISTAQTSSPEESALEGEDATDLPSAASFVCRQAERCIVPKLGPRAFTIECIRLHYAELI
jgi:hypothetical protein